MVGLDALLDLPGLGRDLARVEDALRASVRSEDPFLTEVARHLIDAGGKRLRPALALAAAHAGGMAGGDAPTDERVVRGAVSVELVHLGSLYHDDVMDEAATRRNVESVNARWGNLVAILAGDFLLARASEIAADLGPEVSALLAATIGHLCEGQVRELAHAFDTSRSEDAYLTAIAGKTAALMSASCRIGALAAALPQRQVDALTEYGRRLGMAFQIVDDVLDVVATDEELGKPAGNDLVEGVYTLPVIRALAEQATHDALVDLLGHPIDRAGSDTARAVIRSNGAVAAALASARRYADEAAGALDTLDDNEAVDALRGLGHRLVEAVPL